MASSQNDSVIQRALDHLAGKGGKPLDAAREQRRLDIVAAATELFVQHGYKKTAMEEIAARCGVSKGTLYLYYDSKASLLVHALSEEKRKHANAMAFMEDSEVSPKEKLRRFIVVVLSMASDMPLLTRLMSGDRELFAALAELPDRLHDDRRLGLRELLGGILEQGVAAHGWSAEKIGERAAVMGGLTYFSSLLSEPHVRFGLTRERFALVLANALVEGMGASCE